MAFISSQTTADGTWICFKLFSYKSWVSRGGGRGKKRKKKKQRFFSMEPAAYRLTEYLRGNGSVIRDLRSAPLISPFRQTTTKPKICPWPCLKILISTSYQRPKKTTMELLWGSSLAAHASPAPFRAVSASHTNTHTCKISTGLLRGFS